MSARPLCSLCIYSFYFPCDFLYFSICYSSFHVLILSIRFSFICSPSLSFFHSFSYLYHPPTPFTLSFTLFTPLPAHSLILSSLIPPLPSHSSHPETHPPNPPFSLTLSQSPPSSLHTVTSFLLPVRTPWFEATPPPLLPPPPGMKCSCSIVFCLFAAKASLLAL